MNLFLRLCLERESHGECEIHPTTNEVIVVTFWTRVHKSLIQLLDIALRNDSQQADVHYSITILDKVITLPIIHSLIVGLFWNSN